MSEVHNITDGIEAAVAAMLSRLTPRSAEEVRANQLANDILPRLKVLGFEERFRHEITAWACKPQEDVFRRVMGLCRGNGAVVALVGLRGAGKTTIAAQMAIHRARAWFDHYRDQLPGRPAALPHYLKAVDLLNQFKAIYSDFGAINADDIAQTRDFFCRERGLAVIDELHDCEDRKLKERVLVDVIDRRYAARNDTILISNQTPDDFKATTNDSILSRLSEHGRIIPCNWGSHRSKR